jgi:RNA polymerase sigma factor (sigma-70 family)
MAAPQQVGHVPVTSLPDEELAPLYQQLQLSSLASVVVERNFPWIADRARRLAQRWQLQPTDEDDAQEAGVVAFYEALKHYRNLSLDPDKPSPFRPFLCCKVRDAVSDFVRSVQRELKHVRGSPQVENVLQLAPNNVRLVIANPDALDPERTDPRAPAEATDFLAQVEKVIDQLEPHMRELWDRRKDGATFKAIAEAMGVDYSTVRRWWGTLKAELRSRFRDLEPY